MGYSKQSKTATKRYPLNLLIVLALSFNRCKFPDPNSLIFHQKPKSAGDGNIARVFLPAKPKNAAPGIKAQVFLPRPKSDGSVARVFLPSKIPANEQWEHSTSFSPING